MDATEVYFAGVASGALAIAIGFLLTKLWRPRMVEPMLAPPPTGPPASEVPPPMAGPPPVRPALTAVTLPSVARFVDPLTFDDGVIPPRRNGFATPERVGLSKRVVEHLFQQGRLGPDDVGSPTATQRGMQLALGANQSALSKVLRRLEVAGVVEVTKRHVTGGERRLKVYGLTRRGELLAHDLRRRGATAPNESGEGRPSSVPRSSESLGGLVAGRSR